MSTNLTSLKNHQNITTKKNDFFKSYKVKITKIKHLIKHVKKIFFLSTLCDYS